MNVIEIKDLNFSYNKDHILKDLNLNIKDGEFISICAQNGCGKSTLLKLILGQLKKDSGEIRIFGKKIEEFKSFYKIGYVPQVNSNKKIAFPITNLEYLCLNMYSRFGFLKLPRKHHKDKAYDLLCQMNLKDKINKPFNELSGGQQQRVMIASALVNDPELLILDEPTVGIDKESKKEFLELLNHINKKHNITIIIVTHELEIIEKYLDNVVKLEEGRIC